ncbi:CLIP domain-containing serine protease 2-like isoform X2 [Hyposmocoma kahamanoa]|uniref:CLIP domain-containing serine protease 2-like isoform X2 n=1 Tax=Hyposmocoma kahamanoa TaxID=1477025 RepID=UPI000E6D8EAF|nr:CLIP domain-containing serine protease 2-like isoform X2 [Hyposmocoma kahamanoa]
MYNSRSTVRSVIRSTTRTTPTKTARFTNKSFKRNPPARRQNANVALPLTTPTYRNSRNKRCNGGAPCVTLNECTHLYNQLQRGTTPQLTALLRSLHCGFQYGNPLICCPPEFHNPNNGGDGDQRAGFDATSLLPNNHDCGIQNKDRIVGGTQADLDEHPWMALLRYDKPYGWGFYCGGVLISLRYVLTAAHCVKGDELPTNWKLSQVRLGEWNTSSTNDCLADDCAGPVQDIPVEQIIPHEDYDPKDANQHNDIALLRLAQNARITDFVKPICLPLSSELKRSSFEGLTMEVAGWGRTESRTESNVKLKVRVPVVSRSECAKVFNRVSREITNKQMCAGGNAGEDSCRGDSGGALMGEQLGVSDNWYAVGVVSYGPSPCGTPGWPGVYTRVGAYVDWILSKLRP